MFLLLQKDVTYLPLPTSTPNLCDFPIYADYPKAVMNDAAEKLLQERNEKRNVPHTKKN